jgi:biopolymer transport protein TolR
MSMASNAGANRLQNEPNVTPMIDVLLVLLIIFMLVVPMSRKAIDLQLPDPTEAQSSATPPPQIVLEVLPGEKYMINKEPITKADLPKRLKEIFDPRPEKIVFIKGDLKVKYSDVIAAIDMSRGAGVKVIGYVSPKEAH